MDSKKIEEYKSCTNYEDESVCANCDSGELFELVDRALEFGDESTSDFEYPIDIDMLEIGLDYE